RLPGGVAEGAVVGEVGNGCGTGLADDGAGGGIGGAKERSTGHGEDAGTCEETAAYRGVVEGERARVGHRKRAAVKREWAGAGGGVGVVEDAQGIDGYRCAGGAQRCVAAGLKRPLLHGRAAG